MRASWALLRRTLLTTIAVAATAGLPGRATGAIGDLDPTFGAGGKVMTAAPQPFFGSQGLLSALALQADGKLVVAGNSGGDFGLARFLPDGSLDGSFGAGGKVSTDFGGPSSQQFDHANGVLIEPDGKIIAVGLARSGGFTSHIGLARYLPNGGLDDTFGTNGTVFTPAATLLGAYGVARRPDGKLVVVGHGFLARYESNGNPDSTFGANGIVSDTSLLWRAVALDPDGRLIVAGGTSTGFIVGRYLEGGAPDPSFGGTGRVTADFGVTPAGAGAVVLQPDGKIVAAGGKFEGSPSPPFSDFMLARYLSDGTPDPGFGVAGKVTTDFGETYDVANALLLQSDGRLVAAGLANWGPGLLRKFGVARYNADGVLDASFGSAGLVVTDFGTDAFATGLVLQTDGRLVAGGLYNSGYALARYLPDASNCPVESLAAAPETRSAALTSEEGPSLNPAVFRRLRSQVLMRTSVGRRLTERYNTHGPEVVRLLVTDAKLRRAAMRGLLVWQPVVAALADGRGSVSITAEQARLVDEVLDQLSAAASPALRRAIDSERRSVPPGLNVAQTLVREVSPADVRIP